MDNNTEELKKDEGQNVQKPNPQKEEKPKNKKDIVEVERGELVKILKKMEENEKEIKMLKEVADKGRLAHWQSTHEKESPKIYRLTTHDDKVVLGWKMVTNQVWKDSNGEWQEKQEIQLSLDNGEKVILSYPEFITKTHKIEARLVGSSQKGSITFLELETASGEKYVVDSTFVN